MTFQHLQSCVCVTDVHKRGRKWERNLIVPFWVRLSKYQQYSVNMVAPQGGTESGSTLKWSKSGKRRKLGNESGNWTSCEGRSKVKKLGRKKGLWVKGGWQRGEVERDNQSVLEAQNRSCTHTHTHTRFCLLISLLGPLCSWLHLVPSHLHHLSFTHFSTPHYGLVDFIISL